MAADDGLEWSRKLVRKEFATSGAVANRQQPKGRKEREETLRDLFLPNETFEDAKKRFQGITKSNINALLQWRAASAGEIGVDARWLRRLRDDGLQYPSPVSRKHLERLADFFGYSSYLDLWKHDLLDQMGLPEPTEKQVVEWRHSPNWKRAEKVLELLDTGEFKHLGKLIDDLHELEIARTARKSEKPAAESKSIADFMKKRKRS